MSIYTVSSSDFVRGVGTAKRATATGPVFITDRGQPAFVLLSIEEYYRLAVRKKISVLELMDSLPKAEGIDYDAPRANIQLKPVKVR